MVHIQEAVRADNNPFLTVEESISYLRSSRTSLYRRVRAGQLKPLKLGIRTLFRRSDLDALIDRCAS